MVDIHLLIMARLGIEDETRAYLLQAAAEAKLRAYLNLWDGSLERYAPAIVDLAETIQHESEAIKAVATTDATAPGALKAESFSEGGVSVRNEYATATISDISEYYAKRYDEIFDGLKTQRRGRILRRGGGKKC